MIPSFLETTSSSGVCSCDDKTTLNQKYLEPFEETPSMSPVNERSTFPLQTMLYNVYSLKLCQFFLAKAQAVSI